MAKHGIHSIEFKREVAGRCSAPGLCAGAIGRGATAGDPARLGQDFGVCGAQKVQRQLSREWLEPRSTVAQ